MSDVPPKPAELLQSEFGVVDTLAPSTRRLRIRRPKAEFTKKRYDKWCWQIYRGDDLAGLIESFTNGKWGVYGLGGSGRISKQPFATPVEALAWVNANPDVLPL